MSGMESSGASPLPSSLPEEMFDEDTDVEVVEGELVPRRAAPRSRQKSQRSRDGS